MIYRVTEEEKYNFGSKKNQGYCESGFQKKTKVNLEPIWHQNLVK